MEHTIINKDKIAYQGQEGAYSHMACLDAFPEMEPFACDSFEEVFDVTTSGFTKAALIPVENSQAGRVADIHNLLPNSTLNITGEYFHRVKHQLLGLSDSNLEDIKTAGSHFHALAQCRNFLLNNKIKPEIYIDTAAAAEAIYRAKDMTKAAIASVLSSDIYGLKILAKNIEDDSNNTTRFLVMRSDFEGTKNTSQDIITSFVFKVRNMPSALYKALGGFASNRVNMLKLESYMLKGSFTATQFYADVEGHLDDKNVKLAFEELGFFTKEVKILGSYPAHPYRKMNNK